MTKRILYMLLASVLCLLAGCAGTAKPTSTPAPAESPAVPAVTPTQAPVSDWAALYRSFLENTELPLPLSYGVTAVGLCDLDFDVTPELILFDQGASAACGVHFYDIDDVDTVVYVSGNSDAQPLSSISVSATGAADFHLLSLPDGSKMFYCDSGNGNDQFLFRACIAFERGETLELREVAWWSGDYDEASGDYLPTDYRVDGKDATKDEYTKALDTFFDGTEELPCPLALIRLFDGDYSSDVSGLLAMYDDTCAAYTAQQK